MKSLSLALALSALALTAAAPEAQQVLPMSPGARVRVSLDTVTGGDKAGITAAPRRSTQHVRIGTVAAVRADTLVLKEGVDGALHAIPLASVQTLEMSRGRRGHTVMGALLGLVTGAAIGWAVAGSTVDCPPNDICFDEAFAPIGGALIGGLGGVVVGAAIGASIRGERWEVIPAPSWKTGLRPGAGGLGLSLSAQLRF